MSDLQTIVNDLNSWADEQQKIAHIKPLNTELLSYLPEDKRNEVIKPSESGAPAFTFNRSALATLFISDMLNKHKGSEDEKMRYIQSLLDPNQFKDEKKKFAEDLYKTFCVDKDYAKITEMFYDGAVQSSQLMDKIAHRSTIDDPSTIYGKTYRTLGFMMIDFGQEMERYDAQDPATGKKEKYATTVLARKRGIDENVIKNNYMKRTFEGYALQGAGNVANAAAELKDHVERQDKKTNESVERQNNKTNIGYFAGNVVAEALKASMIKSYHHEMHANNPKGYDTPGFGNKISADLGLIKTVVNSEMYKRGKDQGPFSAWMEKFQAKINEKPERLEYILPFLKAGKISDLVNLTVEKNEKGNLVFGNDAVPVTTFEGKDPGEFFEHVEKRQENIENFKAWAKSFKASVGAIDIFKKDLTQDEINMANHSGVSLGRDSLSTISVGEMMRAYFDNDANSREPEDVVRYFEMVVDPNQMTTQKPAIGKQIMQEYVKDGKQGLAKKVIEDLEIMEIVGKMVAQVKGNTSLLYTTSKYVSFDMTQEMGKLKEFTTDYTKAKYGFDDAEANNYFDKMQTLNATSKLGLSDTMSSLITESALLDKMLIQDSGYDFIMNFVIQPYLKAANGKVTEAIEKADGTIFDTFEKRDRISDFDAKFMEVSQSDPKCFKFMKDLGKAMENDPEMFDKMLVGIQSGEIFKLFNTSFKTNEYGEAKVEIEFPKIEDIAKFGTTVSKDIQPATNPAASNVKIEMVPQLFGPNIKDYREELLAIKKGFDETKTFLAKPSAEYVSFYNALTQTLADIDSNKLNNVASIRDAIGNLMDGPANAYQLAKLKSVPIHGQQPKRLALMNRLETLRQVMSQKNPRSLTDTTVMKMRLASKIVTEQSLLLCQSKNKKELMMGCKAMGLTTENYVVEHNSDKGIETGTRLKVNSKYFMNRVQNMVVPGKEHGHDLQAMTEMTLNKNDDQLKELLNVDDKKLFNDYLDVMGGILNSDKDIQVGSISHEAGVNKVSEPEYNPISNNP